MDRSLKELKSLRDGSFEAGGGGDNSEKNPRRLFPLGTPHTSRFFFFAFLLFFFLRLCFANLCYHFPH